VSNRLLSISRVCDQTSYSANWIYKLVLAKKFPQPIKLGRLNRWSEAQVQAWIGRREAGVALEQEPTFQEQEARVSA